MRDVLIFLFDPQNGMQGILGFYLGIFAVIYLIRVVGYLFVRIFKTDVTVKVETYIDDYVYAKDSLVDCIKAYWWALLLGVVSIPCILVGASIVPTEMPLETLETISWVGGVGVILILAIFIIKSLAHQEVADLIMTPYAKYKDPEYVTKAAYLVTDYGTKGKELARVTYDKNAGDNLISFVLNVFNLIFRIIGLIAMAIMDFIAVVLYTLFKVLACMVRPILRTIAKNRYKSMLLNKARKGIFSLVYDWYPIDEGQEIVDEVHNDLIASSVASIVSKKKKFAFANENEQGYFVIIQLTYLCDVEVDGEYWASMYEGRDVRLVINYTPDDSEEMGYRFGLMSIELNARYVLSGDEAKSIDDEAKMIQDVNCAYVEHMRKTHSKNYKVVVMIEDGDGYTPVVAKLKDIEILPPDEYYSYSRVSAYECQSNISCPDECEYEYEDEYEEEYDD